MYMRTRVYFPMTEAQKYIFFTAIKIVILATINSLFDARTSLVLDRIHVFTSLIHSFFVATVNQLIFQRFAGSEVQLHFTNNPPKSYHVYKPRYMSTEMGLCKYIFILFLFSSISFSLTDIFTPTINLTCCANDT